MLKRCIVFVLVLSFLFCFFAVPAFASSIPSSPYTMTLAGTPFTYYIVASRAYFTLWKGSDYYYLSYTYSGEVTPNLVDDVNDAYLLSFSTYSEAYGFLITGNNVPVNFVYGSFSYSELGYVEMYGSSGTTVQKTPPETIVDTGFGEDVTEEEGLLGWLSGFFDKLLDFVIHIVIPRDGYFDNFMESCMDKCPFLYSILSIGDHFLEFFSQSHDVAPTIPVKLSSSEGSYDYGINTEITFAWFERYKPFTDKIISSFLWIVFLWNLFCNLPSILSGMGASSSNAVVSDLSSHIPPNLNPQNLLPPGSKRK